MEETIIGYDKKEMIKHIYRYRHQYKGGWLVMLIAYCWLMINGFKYTGYLFLPCTNEICLPDETRMLISALWVLCIIATMFVVYSGVWIVLIEAIYKKNIEGGNKK